MSEELRRKIAKVIARYILPRAVILIIVMLLIGVAIGYYIL